MSLQDFLSALDTLVAEASSAFDAASDDESLEIARVRYLGQKSGALRDIQKQMGAIDQGDRKAAGMRFNESKAAIQEAFDACKARLGKGDSDALDPTFDPTLPGMRPPGRTRSSDHADDSALDGDHGADGVRSG